MEYQIGDFATISRLGIKTLRYYHEIGLLKPSRIERSSGYRYYDESCLARVNAIQQMKTMLFSLSEIADILDGKIEPEAVQQKISQKMSEVEQQIEEFEEVRQRLTLFLHNKSTMLLLLNPVEQKILPNQLVASIRFHGSFHEINEKIQLLMQTCRGVLCGPPFSLYYDDHPMEDENDIEICVPVLQTVENEVISSRMLHGGEALCILHEGYYDQISSSYQALVDAVQSKQLTIQYPIREMYLVGGNSNSSDVILKYKTEIQFVLK
ncbi:MAG: hypothetical protein C0410_10120 [Anaerolinea sp.]|nr:hypothetical protein [Anaerolinea sp.]